MDQNEYYKKAYTDVLNNGLIGNVADLVHKQLEKNTGDLHDRILEVGAGHGQHLEYVQSNFLEYYETDFRLSNLPFRATKDEKRVVQSYADATNLENFKDNDFDRVIATCLIVHLEKPEFALKEWRRVTKHGGLISIQVACEPGIVLRFLRRITTVRKARKIGLDHLKFHYREHINYYIPIEMLINEVFESDFVSRKFWPFRVQSWNLNLVTIFQIKIDKTN